MASHYDPGWRRRPPRSTREELTEPPEPKGLRSRLRSLRESVVGTASGIRKVFALVWGASKTLTLMLALSTALAGLVPAAQAYTIKLLVNTVVNAIIIHTRHAPDRMHLAVPVVFATIRAPVMSVVTAVIVLAVVQLVIAAVSALLQTLTNISQQLLQERVSMRVQLLIMEHASTLDLSFFEDAHSYDILQQAQREATSRPVSMVSGTFGLVRTFLTFLTMVALLIGVSPWLALLALVAPIPSFMADARYGWRGYAIARWNSPVRRRMAYLLQLLTTDTYAKEVKLFTLGTYLIERFRGLAQGYYNEQRSLITRRYLAGYAWGGTSILVSSGTYLYVALQAVVGRLTLGDLTLYTQAATSVQSSFQSILSGLSTTYEHNLYLSSLFELLAEKPRVESPEHPAPMVRPVRGSVEFQEVSFRYEGSERDVLKDVSFAITPGETVAIVGPNGAGKTTLIKLLTRLYDPTSGNVLVDGRDVREYDLDELHNEIGSLYQDYATYQTTARENIGFGQIESMEDSEAIEASAERGGATEVIERLPDRYETMLGKWFDEGFNLSGGEWQKVALSRAFMRQAKILILDEPTAALDAQAEYELFSKLRTLTQGKTTIFISHRFSTVRLADRILVLQGGELVEQGSHRGLIEQGGLYARLFTLQASAYLPDEYATELGDEVSHQQR